MLRQCGVPLQRSIQAQVIYDLRHGRRGLPLKLDRLLPRLRTVEQRTQIERQAADREPAVSGERPERDRVRRRRRRGQGGKREDGDDEHRGGCGLRGPGVFPSWEAMLHR